MVQSSTHVNVLIQQQGDHHELAVVTIEHHDISEFIICRSKAYSPVSLPLYGPSTTSVTIAVASDGQPDAFLLSSRLRKFRLVLCSVGRCESEAIDKFCLTFFPQP